MDGRHRLEILRLAIPSLLAISVPFFLQIVQLSTITFVRLNCALSVDKQLRTGLRRRPASLAKFSSVEREKQNLIRCRRAAAVAKSK